MKIIKYYDLRCAIMPNISISYQLTRSQVYLFYLGTKLLFSSQDTYLLDNETSEACNLNILDPNHFNVTFVPLQLSIFVCV